jgi:D-sedoheptulose 7-phosphate isomerase
VLLSGKENKEIAEISDIVINAPSDDTPRIQEIHLIVEHIICEIVEKEMIEQT